MHVQNEKLLKLLSKYMFESSEDSSTDESSGVKTEKAGPNCSFFPSKSYESPKATLLFSGQPKVSSLPQVLSLKPHKPVSFTAAHLTQQLQNLPKLAFATPLQMNKKIAPPIVERSANYLNAFDKVFFTLEADLAEVKIFEQKEIGPIASRKSFSNGKFRNVFGTSPLLPGSMSFFEILCRKGSNFKIGVATQKAADLTYDGAFSDEKEGWAYYSLGQLRHNSKGSGVQYGEVYGTSDRIGVYVDLDEGCIFFSKNGVLFEDAYKSSDFKDKTLFPAISFLCEGDAFEFVIPDNED